MTRNTIYLYSFWTNTHYVKQYLIVEKCVDRETDGLITIKDICTYSAGPE